MPKQHRFVPARRKVNFNCELGLIDEFDQIASTLELSRTQLLTFVLTRLVSDFKADKAAFELHWRRTNPC